MSNDDFAPLDFLAMDEVLSIHAHQVQTYGGILGIRDIGMLEAAIAMPQAAYADQYVHGDVFEMAAAYLFHICKNHAFVDGNKRCALACALVFLGLNGYSLSADADDLYALVDGTAASQVTKSEISVFFREHCRKK